MGSSLAHGMHSLSPANCGPPDCASQTVLALRQGDILELHDRTADDPGREPSDAHPRALDHSANMSMSRRHRSP